MKYKSKNFYYYDDEEEGITATDIIYEEPYDNVDTGLLDLHGDPILREKEQFGFCIRK